MIAMSDGGGSWATSSTCCSAGNVGMIHKNNPTGGFLSEEPSVHSLIPYSAAASQAAEEETKHRDRRNVPQLKHALGSSGHVNVTGTHKTSCVCWETPQKEAGQTGTKGKL